jgi:fructokinase
MIGAIEAGGTKFVVALAAPDGSVIERARIATTTPDETFAAVRSFFDRTSAELGALTSIGIASFGPIELSPASADYGMITSTPKPGWTGASFVTALRGYGVPLTIATDVEGAALAEATLGAGRGLETVAYTTVGTGIGTAIVRNGQPVRGFTHMESGHTQPPHDRSLDPYSGLCPYHGDCLEGLASGPAIAARWGMPLSEVGDPAAIDLIASYLSHLAATLILLHAPDRLIFGGGVMDTPGLIEAMRVHTQERVAGYVAHPRLDDGLKDYIAAPGLGSDSGLTGAILLGRGALL